MGAAAAQDPAASISKKALIRNERIAEAKAKVAVDDALYRYTGHHAPPPVELSKPILIEHPVDPDLQTGDSALLGGAMELKAPWKRD